MADESSIQTILHLYSLADQYMMEPLVRYSLSQRKLYPDTDPTESRNPNDRFTAIRFLKEKIKCFKILVN